MLARWVVIGASVGGPPTVDGGAVVALVDGAVDGILGGAVVAAAPSRLGGPRRAAVVAGAGRIATSADGGPDDGAVSPQATSRTMAEATAPAPRPITS